jgi:hypothetical protein
MSDIYLNLLIRIFWRFIGGTYGAKKRDIFLSINTGLRRSLLSDEDSEYFFLNTDIQQSAKLPGYSLASCL